MHPRAPPCQRQRLAVASRRVTLVALGERATRRPPVSDTRFLPVLEFLGDSDPACDLRSCESGGASSLVEYQ